MTEQEWHRGHDVEKMIHFVTDRASERKLRLFCVACCSRMWHQLTDQRSREAALVLSAFADGKATAQELHEAWIIATAAAVDDGPDAHTYVTFAQWMDFHLNFNPELAPARLIADATRSSARDAALACATAPFRHWCQFTVPVLHDLFGNPFHPIKLAEESLNERVVAAAKRIYEQGSWDEMGFLADALVEAGCTQEEVLEHCHGRGEHGRGCWVVDLVLGKE